MKNYCFLKKMSNTLGYIYIVRRDGTQGKAFPIDKTEVTFGRYLILFRFF